MQRTLILGYGNFDRQDDGVAWHVLAEVARRLGRAVPDSPDEEFTLEAGAPDDGANDFLFELQLTPELAETLAEYERVCFVDAHTGAVANDVNVVQIAAEFQASPLTHHLTPQSLLSFVQALYNARPEAILVSVRGYQFGFERTLSPMTAELAQQAADTIVKWVLDTDL
ncbi:hydrogenase maturation protease [Thermoflexales bacterium]|nr:hydrogenase maturation protease [Thermoflexales bacterium]